MEFIGVYATEKDLVEQTEWSKFFDLLTEQGAKHYFGRPFGIAADSSGRIYVSDSVRGNIQVFDFEHRTMEYLGAEFLRPMGLATDNQDHLYVADGQGKTIFVFSKDWHLIKRIGDDKTLSNPSFIAVNNQLGRIYISDAPKHKIAVFSLEGIYLFSIGGPGNGDGQFAVPQGLTFDNDGRLFVADMLNSRVQVFDADGRFLYKFGVQSTDYWCFENPRDLKFSTDNLVYVVDYRKAMLQAYTPEGQIVFALGTNSKPSTHKFEFGTPLSLAISPENKIYIVDSINKRVSAWQILPNQSQIVPLLLQ